MNRWMRSCRLLRAAMLAAVFGGGGALALAAPVIQSITGSAQGSRQVVRIDLSEPITTPPAGFMVQSPARIALDFPGVANGTGDSNVAINQGNLRGASIAEVSDRTRVVLNLNHAVTYETRLVGKSVIVLLGASAAEPPVAPRGAFTESTADRAPPLRDIDFRRGTDNAGRIIVDLPSDQVGVDVKEQGGGLAVDFLDVRLPEGLRRKLDVSDFGTPVQRVTTTESGGRVHMKIEVVGAWEHSAYQSDRQFVLEVRQRKVDPNKLTDGPGFHGEKLSLNFQNIDVRSLLQVIADFTNFNIVTSDSVQGSLTLRLKDVPWDQALNIILEAKDLGMRRSGNVLRIAPKDELAAKEKAELEAQAAINDLQQLSTEAFQLNYTKAEEIQTQLLSSTGSGTGAGSRSGTLLSERGSVVIDRRTNQIFVSDIPSRLAQIREMIAKLDIPIRQVLIEARIVEASDTFGKSLGVRLGMSDGTAPPGIAIGNKGDQRIAIGGRYSALPTAAGQPVAASQFVDFPAALGLTNPASFALSLFSSKHNTFLNLELSALEADGKGRIVSSPRVVTADQAKASIEQGTEIPYQEASSSGATAISFRKAVLKLEVTPQITPEGNIILDLDVNKDSQGDIIPDGVIINTKHVTTQVLVENGGTVVIGGIFEMSEQNNVDKVPGLGDIPVLGNLFKSRTQTSEKKEMLVFITPRIVSGANLVR